MNKLNYATCGCGAAVRGAAQLVHAEHYGTKSLGNLQKTIIAVKRGICSLLQIQSAIVQASGVESNFHLRQRGWRIRLRILRAVYGVLVVWPQKKRESCSTYPPARSPLPPPSPPLQVHDIWPVRTHRNRHAHLHRHGESPAPCAAPRAARNQARDRSKDSTTPTRFWQWYSISWRRWKVGQCSSPGGRVRRRARGGQARALGTNIL